MRAWLSNKILKWLGWTIEADDPGVGKYVLIVAPHTSNWDFPLGLAAAWALRLDARWLGKHTLFCWPYGWFFRLMGGIPVRRDQARNLIPAIADIFARSERLILGLAPEGTRRKTDHWKTGFYHIARAAGVPIVMGYLDHGRKQVGIGGAFLPGDDIEEVFCRIREFYAGKRGKHPENESDIRDRPRI